MPRVAEEDAIDFGPGWVEMGQISSDWLEIACWRCCSARGQAREGMRGKNNRYSVTNRINTRVFDSFKCYKDRYKLLPQALQNGL